MVVMVPPGVMGNAYTEWERAMLFAEERYSRLRDLGVKPEIARSVLPNSLKTEVVMTANFREWLYVLELRTSRAAHPQIRELMGLARMLLHNAAPTVFS